MQNKINKRGKKSTWVQENSSQQMTFRMKDILFYT